MPEFGRVGIVGVGLIGGSLGLALLSRGGAAEVIGLDRDPRALRDALAVGAVSRAGGPADLRDAELVVLAVPVGQLAAAAREVRPFLSPGTVVTDVASTKRRPVGQLAAVLGPEILYVGGHPMAGSEQAGAANADAYMFENAVYLLTPTAGTPARALAAAERLVRAVGAQPLLLDPAEHDLAVAAVSHLPHLVAAGLLNTLAGLAPEHPVAPSLAAGGFRDTTRVGASDPSLWRDILLDNREEVLGMLGRFRQVLDRWEEALRRADGEALADLLREARETRARLPERSKDYWPRFWELVARVADRPGAIGELAAALGANGVNIADIEILRVREGEDGSIRLAFRSEEELARAETVLRGLGIAVRRR